MIHDEGIPHSTGALKMLMTSCVAQGVSVLATAARPHVRERTVRRHKSADRSGAAVMTSSSSGKCEGCGCVASHNNDLQGAVRREEEYLTSTTQAVMGRRASLAASIALTAFGSVSESARAANEPVDPTTSPLVQGELIDTLVYLCCCL